MYDIQYSSHWALIYHWAQLGAILGALSALLRIDESENNMKCNKFERNGMANLHAIFNGQIYQKRCLGSINQ